MTYERNNAMYQLYYSWEAHMQSLYVYTHAYMDMDLQYKYKYSCKSKSSLRRHRATPACRDGGDCVSKRSKTCVCDLVERN